MIEINKDVEVVFTTSGAGEKISVKMSGNCLVIQPLNPVQKIRNSANKISRDLLYVWMEHE